MQDIPNLAPVAIAFIKLLFHGTEFPVYFSSLANDRDDAAQPREQHVHTRLPEDVERFLTKWDRRGRGMFFCVATLEQRKRNKDNAREIAFLWVDVDFKGIDSTQDVSEALARLRYPPSVTVQSGHGLHLYWLLKEPADAVGERERLEAALRLLADHVAGDLQVCEVARLMRLPGSHNTKGGEWIEVTAIAIEVPRYTLEELEEWLAEAAPVLRRKKGARAGAGTAQAPDNPFLAAAQALGWKPPVDVAARLEAMSYGGAEDDGVHRTQLSVSASLLNAGNPVDEVVTVLMDATVRAAGDLGARWNWRREEAAIRRMCATWLEKHPQPARGENPPKQQGGIDPPENEQVENEHVIDLGAARAARKPKGRPKSTDTPRHVVLAEALLEVLRSRGEVLMFTSKGAWRYADGLWRLEPDLYPWLNSQIEGGARGLGWDSNIKLINETRSFIVRHPGLWVEMPEFDTHRCIPTKSGLVDPRDGRLIAPHPDQFVTWRIEVDYDPAALCPFWLQMLNDALADRAPDVRAQYVALLQELLGAGLIDARSKALSRALVLWGPQDSGKSGLLDVLGGLFGDDLNTTPLSAVVGEHGTMNFLQRRPWVLHEAFEQSRWHMSSVVKSLISGEDISVNVKRGPFLSTRMRAPVFWGTNHAPQFQEATQAIIERLAIVQCRQQFDKDNPIGVALAARRRGFEKPSELVLAVEKPGVLAWAVEGLRRCLERGHFILPAEALEVAHEVHLDSNIVAGFVEDCLDFTPQGMVSVPDFVAAFSAWWHEHKGEDRGAPSSKRVGRALRALGEQRIAQSPDLRTDTRRYYAGINLNAEGRRFWQYAVSSDTWLFQGKKASTTSADGSPNAIIPPEWDAKPELHRMRRAQDDVSKNRNVIHHDVSRNVIDSSSTRHRDQASDPAGKTEF
jgi:P4 family phage/plasmid primase-like protien